MTAKKLLTVTPEQKAQLQAIDDEWQGAYQPRTPAQKVLVDMGVQLAFQHENCKRLLHALCQDELQANRARHDPEPAHDVPIELWDRHFANFKKHCDGSIRHRVIARELGVQWILGEWDRLLAKLDEPCGWSSEDIKSACGLCGFEPMLVNRREQPFYWDMWYFGLSARTMPNPAEFKNLFTPEYCPPDRLGIEGIADRDWARARLEAIIRNERAHMVQILEALQRRRAEAVARENDEATGLPLDPHKQQLYLRYQTATVRLFAKTVGDLTKALKTEGPILDEHLAGCAAPAESAHVAESEEPESAHVYTVEAEAPAVRNELPVAPETAEDTRTCDEKHELATGLLTASDLADPARVTREAPSREVWAAYLLATEGVVVRYD